MTAEQIICAAGYRVVSAADFRAATDVPPRMRLLAERLFARWGGDFVVYDPASGDDGWLLIDDDREQIVGETVEHLGRLAMAVDGDEPAQKSLF